MGARVLAILVLVATAAGRKAGSQSAMAYGVIGNTTVSGTVILGSSPGIPAKFLRGLQLTRTNKACEGANDYAAEGASGLNCSDSEFMQ